MSSYSTTSVWHTSPGADLPRLTGKVNADVCVVGLGGSGLSAVGEALSLGLTVVGIDADEIGSGAAGRNGGFLLAGTAAFYHHAIHRFGRERALSIYRRTLEEIDRFGRETPDVIRRTGSLRIASSSAEEADCRLHLEALRADGLPAEPYEGREGRGLLIPSDAVFNPLARCRARAGEMVRRGARIFEKSPAIEIRGNEVITVGGRIECGSVVTAIDGRLDQILPELKDRVRTARLQMLATAPTREVSFTKPVYTRWGRDYWQQLPDGRLAVGGFRDEFEAEEWTHEARPSKHVQSRIENFLRFGLGVQAAITHRWAALVGFSSSGLPFLGEVRPRIWAAGGYSGTGNLIGSICGRAAVRLAAGEESADAKLFA